MLRVLKRFLSIYPPQEVLCFNCLGLKNTMYEGLSAAPNITTLSSFQAKNFGDLRHLDVLKYPIPFANFESNVKFKEYSVLVKDCDVNVIESEPNGISPYDNVTKLMPGYHHRMTFLFLHGRSFTSKTWFDLKTMHLVSHMGHRGLAVDLPGYGKTTCRKPVDNKTTPPPTDSIGAEKQRLIKLRDKSGFLDLLLKRLIQPPDHNGDFQDGDEDVLREQLVPGVVLVSPSMSGAYSLPYVMFHARGAIDEVPQQEEDYRTVRAFVPIAPVGTESFDFSDYKSLHIPTLVVYGALDTGVGLVSRRALEQIPTSVVAEIPAAGHACYLDQPAVWHRILYNFIRAID